MKEAIGKNKIMQNDFPRMLKIGKNEIFDKDEIANHFNTFFPSLMVGFATLKGR